MICGDFNLPGTSPDTIDNELAELLHSTSFSQFVQSPTRHDSHHDRSSLLDLIITPSSSKLVIDASVVSSHEISDHDLTLTNLNTKRYKSPQRTYHYRNIKGIDLELFEQTILSSSLFSSPDPTVDGYANQMETELTLILDKVAPLKAVIELVLERHLMLLTLRNEDVGLSGDGRLPMPSLTALPIGPLARLQTS